MPDPLSEKDWRDLLRLIHDRQVIPVVGPCLVTVIDPATGEQVALHRHLAPALARGLGLEHPESFASWNDVARAHLLGGGARGRVYEELRELLDTIRADPPPALLALASITDFDLFISSTPDGLLAQALTRQRPGFSPDRDVIRFHPQGLSGVSSDLPPSFAGPLLHHILGDAATYPDFAVWEEDYMEFICGLLEKADTLEHLFRVLKSRHLLLLGAPSEDWIVRFFLRVARQQRLSERHQRDYLADQPVSLGEPMILFFDQAVKTTRVIAGPPAEFVQTLERAWRERYGAAGSDEELLRRMPAEIPRGAVFLSYARDDLSAAVKLARALETAGVPVWMDKIRLQAGANYEHSLQHEVKDACSFFISLISKATEADPARYVHRERAWAAQRHVDGFVFYVPLVLDLDETTPPRLEPECFRQSHYERWNGATLGNFVRRVRGLVDEFRSAGRPRG
jgi:TIR domain-containing protein